MLMNIINFFNELKHLWKMQTSAKYREQKTLEKGKQLWEKLDWKLPKAEGVTSKDRVRLKMFKKMVEELPQSDRVALRTWLASQTKYWHENFSEHATPREEEIQRKQWQIYSQHLEVVMMWM